MTSSTTQHGLKITFHHRQSTKRRERCIIQKRRGMEDRYVQGVYGDTHREIYIDRESESAREREKRDRERERPMKERVKRNTKTTTQGRVRERKRRCRGREGAVSRSNIYICGLRGLLVRCGPSLSQGPLQTEAVRWLWFSGRVGAG